MVLVGRNGSTQQESASSIIRTQSSILEPSANSAIKKQKTRPREEVYYFFMIPNVLQYGGRTIIWKYDVFPQYHPSYGGGWGGG